MRKVIKLERICQRCGGQFFIYPSSASPGKFCSKGCRTEPLGKKFMRIGWEVVNSGCWEWKGPRTPKNYGYLANLNRCFCAHRVSWEFHCKKIPELMCVLHKCDNPPCVNPDHLFIGTKADNNFDKLKKGRCVAPYGENHGGSKLTTQAVLIIRSTPIGPEVTKKLARQFGVSVTAIHLVRRRVIWNHVD